VKGDCVVQYRLSGVVLKGDCVVKLRYINEIIIIILVKFSVVRNSCSFIASFLVLYLLTLLLLF